MTPLIDVVFQLLIFLMVSSQFIKPDQQVELPSGTQEAVEVDHKIEKHVLTISSENDLTLNEESIVLEGFQEALTQAIAATNITRLEIRGDQSSQLGTFIEVIEIAKGAGIESLSYHKKAEEE